MDTPNNPVVITPEQVVEQLRALQAQIGPVVPLTFAQRRTLREQAKLPQPVVEASINIIGASDNVSQAVGQPAADVRQMLDDIARWTAVEGELRAALNGVAGANLIRRQRVARLSQQAYNIGRQLARDPDHAVLLPHLQEVKRLRSFSRRKKHESEPPAQPAPAPAATGETPNES